MHWAKTPSGGVMPMDLLPSPDGTWCFLNAGTVKFVPEHERAGLALHTSHLATCPFADKHRREK